MKKLILSLILFTVVINYPVFSQDDAAGCKDYSLFNRMPNFYITECVSKEFDSYKYLTGYDDVNGYVYTSVEGKYYFISYIQKEGVTPVSALQISKNYINAVKNSGGELVFGGEADQTYFACVIKKGNKEIWVGSDRVLDGVVDLYIVERESMKQEISVNEMLLALNKDGYYSLYINFDSGKYDLKPEFDPSLSQIALMLTNNPDLKISVEGHTDNVGTAESNQTLSENRAKAVYDYLVGKGVSKDRLSYKGWGQDKPIADNRTEEGKFKNRRVELVKK